jgi:hypothetical protein
MGLIPWDQWFTSDAADTVDGKGVGDSELRFDTEHRGSFSICLMRRFFALWQRIRKELRDTLRPWFHAILMACFTFFAPALDPLFDFLDFLEFALLVGDPRMAPEWKPKKTHDDGVLSRGITPFLLHLGREAIMKCSHKIGTYPPTCAVHNVVLVKFSEEMDEEYNPPGLGHVRCYFCPVGHNFVLIADGM